MNTITNKSYLVRHLSHITPLKISKACTDSFKPLGTTLKMGTKGITLVNARNLTMTFKTKEILNMLRPPGFNDYIVNELYQDVQNFQEG